MTAVETLKPTGDRTRAIGQVSALVVMVLILLFVWKRTRPERLTLVSDQPFTIAGENLYWPQAPADPAKHPEYTIQAQSIYGGKPRTVSHEDAHREFYSDAGGMPKKLNAVAGELYYASMPRKEHRSTGTPLISRGGPVSISMTRRFLGTFLQASRPAAIKESIGPKQTVPSKQLPLLQEVQFRHVSVHDGTSQDLVSLQGTNFCQIGNSVFWIRAKPEEQNEIQQGRAYRLEITPHSDLMLTVLTSGTTRCIRAGISARTSLTPGEAGVTWTEPQLFPRQPLLFYARVADGSLCPLGPADVAGGSVMMAIAPRTVEFAHRCYWAVNSQEAGQLDLCQVLMSANLDGSDRRIVFSQADNHPISQLAFAAYQGNLYCAFAKTPTLKEGRLIYQKYLCRVDPKGTDAVEILRTLPKDSWVCQFADGYLYFVLKEKHLTTWQVLTNDDLADGWTQTLCRFSLN